MIFCEPFFKEDVLKLACPDALSVAVPSVLPPSLKVTVPVGIPPDDEVTWAVNVTAWPTKDGLSEELSVVVVVIFWTVCFSVPELLPKKVPSPPYTALMLCDPVASEDVLNVACPDAFNVPVPTLVFPSKNVTVPVGTPPAPEIDAVKVTICSNADGLADEARVVVLAARFTVCVIAADVLDPKLALPP